MAAVCLHLLGLCEIITGVSFCKNLCLYREYHNRSGCSRCKCHALCKRTALRSVTENIPTEGDKKAFLRNQAYASQKGAENDKLKVVQIIVFGQILIAKVLFSPTLRHLEYSWGEAIQWLIPLKILTISRVYLDNEPCWCPMLQLYWWQLVRLYPAAAVWRFWQHEWLTVW